MITSTTMVTPALASALCHRENPRETTNSSHGPLSSLAQCLLQPRQWLFAIPRTLVLTPSMSLSSSKRHMLSTTPIPVPFGHHDSPNAIYKADNGHYRLAIDLARSHVFDPTYGCRQIYITKDCLSRQN